MLTIEDFKPLKIQDKKIFDKHYKKYPQIHSDNLFTTMISWMDYADYHFNFVENNLIIYTKINNNIRFRPPIGKRNINIFRDVLKLSIKEKIKYPFGLIDNKTKNWLSKTFPNLNFIPYRDYFEYIYLTSNLADLSGSRYSKIRNRLNKFNRNNSYEIEFISEENMNDMKKFLNRWCLWKDCKSDPMLENEKKAITYSMNNYSKLELSGIILLINGEIEAMAIYEQMNSNTVVVHYEKASPYFDGIYKAINYETAKILKDKFMYINRESDMGLPGLRKAKMSYQPHHLIEVFNIERETIVT